jgi:putative ABC transport system substrate-binding protein
MKRKITGLCLCTLLFALCVSAEAQQPKKVPRIGFVAVTGDPNTSNIVEFRRGLRDLGYIEGKNILIEYRYAEGVAEFPNLATELVRLTNQSLV